MKDNEEIFLLYSLFQGVVSNICFYLGTFILSGYSSPLFFTVGGPVILINLFTIFVYAQAER